MRYAIQCLEYELARKLDEVEAMGRELAELRRLNDLRESSPPAFTVTPAPALSAPTEAGAGVGVDPESRIAKAWAIGDPTPAELAELADVCRKVAEHIEPDPAPPEGIVRPVELFMCTHCGKSFSRQNGLSRHLSQSHPIEHRSFDPDKARAAAAEAAYNDGIPRGGGRPKVVA